MALPSPSRPATGVVVPFVASAVLARFWPAVRQLWQAASGRVQQMWHSRGSSGEQSERGGVAA
jgi:hypothetical protein